MTGEYIMNTDRLRSSGHKLRDVFRYTIAEAFADCFKAAVPVAAEQTAETS